MIHQNRPKSPILAVVLDAVGTLIEPNPSVDEIYAQAARRQGVALNPDHVRERFRRSFGTDEIDELRGPMATDEAIEYRRWRRIVASCLPEVPDLQRAFAELWDHFGRPAAWRTFPETGPTLADLDRRGLALRIASNFDARLHGVLDGLEDLARLSASALISSEVGYRKPHPAFYQAVQRSLELPATNILFVGDDLENDWRGPRRAGLQAVLLDPEGRVAASVDTIPSLGGLIGWLSRSG